MFTIKSLNYVVLFDPNQAERAIVSIDNDSNTFAFPIKCISEIIDILSTADRYSSFKIKLLDIKFTKTETNKYTIGDFNFNFNSLIGDLTSIQEIANQEIKIQEFNCSK